MVSRQLWLAVVICAAVTPLRADCEQRSRPCIYEGGIVNGASFAPASTHAVAPNTIVSIFGTDLSLRTRGVQPSDIRGNRLPLELGGVRVLVGQLDSNGNNHGGIAIPLFYVSSGQVNAQLPSSLTPGTWAVRISRENLISNLSVLTVADVSPGLFPVFAHTDFRIVGWGAPEGSLPARPGGIAVAFGTGFGPTIPAVEDGLLPDFAAPLSLPSEVRWNGELLPHEAVLYAGQAPGFAGVCQVNFFVPEDAETGNHEVQVEIDGVPTQKGLFIAVERPIDVP